MWLVVLVFVVLSWTAACPASADVAYTITLTDDQSSALHEQTRLLNERRRAGKGSSRPDLTPTQMLEGVARGIAEGWEVGQHDASAQRPWADRSAHEKRVSCRRQKLAPCPD